MSRIARTCLVSADVVASRKCFQEAISSMIGRLPILSATASDSSNSLRHSSRRPVLRYRTASDIRASSRAASARTMTVGLELLERLLEHGIRPGDGSPCRRS